MLGRSSWRLAQARDAVYGLSRVLGCALPRKTLDLCVELVELGENPEAIAEVIAHTVTATETVQVADARGRVLACDAVACRHPHPQREGGEKEI